MAQIFPLSEQQKAKQSFFGGVGVGIGVPVQKQPIAQKMKPQPLLTEEGKKMIESQKKIVQKEVQQKPVGIGVAIQKPVFDPIAEGFEPIGKNPKKKTGVSDMIGNEDDLPKNLFQSGVQEAKGLFKKFNPSGTEILKGFGSAALQTTAGASEKIIDFILTSPHSPFSAPVELLGKGIQGAKKGFDLTADIVASIVPQEFQESIQEKTGMAMNEWWDSKTEREKRNLEAVFELAQWVPITKGAEVSATAAKSATKIAVPKIARTVEAVDGEIMDIAKTGIDAVSKPVQSFARGFQEVKQAQKLKKKEAFIQGVITEPIDIAGRKKAFQGKSVSEGKGIVGERAFAPDKIQKNIIEELKKIDDIKEENTFLKNKKVVEREIQNNAVALENQLKTKNFDIVEGDKLALKREIERQIKESPSLVGDASAVAERTLNKFYQIVKNKNVKTADDFWKARIELDNWGKSEKKGLFGTEIKSAYTKGFGSVRNAVDEFLIAKSTDIGVKNAFQKMTNLYRSDDIFSIKAMKEGKSRASRFVDNVGKFFGTDSEVFKKISSSKPIQLLALGGAVAAPVSIPTILGAVVAGKGAVLASQKVREYAQRFIGGINEMRKLYKEAPPERKGEFKKILDEAEAIKNEYFSEK